jgi:hypothetical protein
MCRKGVGELQLLTVREFNKTRWQKCRLFLLLARDSSVVTFFVFDIIFFIKKTHQ